VICSGGPSGSHLGAESAVAAQQDRGRRLFKPEELGELEGPDRDAWQKPDLIMDALRIGEGAVVADVGAGGGWFTVRLAKRVGPNGKVYAEDIQPEMLAAIRRRVVREGFNNVLYVQGNTADPADPGLPPDALDAVLIVDAYHEVSKPVTMLKHLGASLKPNGRIGIVGFTLEGGGPGPALNQRVDAQKVIDEAGQAGLRLVSRETFLDFQYLLILSR
jgi:SAM-dependent methyltransferase